MASITSHSWSIFRAGPATVRPPLPTLKGWRSSKPDFPGIDVYTGTSTSSANSRSAAVASANITPAPAQIKGFLCLEQGFHRFADIAVRGLVQRYGPVTRRRGASAGTACSHTSAGISTTTGPGRPLRNA